MLIEINNFFHVARFNNLKNDVCFIVFTNLNDTIRIIFLLYHLILGVLWTVAW